MIFNYNKKIRIALATLLVIAVVGLIWFVVYDRSRTKDLRLVNQVQNLATALEQYYDKFNVYPQVAETDANDILLLTDQGLNESGDTIYYRAQNKFVRPVSFLSSATQYTFKFELKHFGPVWQLQPGAGECRLTTDMLMSCQANE